MTQASFLSHSCQQLTSKHNHPWHDHPRHVPIMTQASLLSHSCQQLMSKHNHPWHDHPRHVPIMTQASLLSHSCQQLTSKHNHPRHDHPRHVPIMMHASLPSRVLVRSRKTRLALFTKISPIVICTHRKQGCPVLSARHPYEHTGS
eukprot:1161563-Pelagomonas_calceolata.AAC.7